MKASRLRIFRLLTRITAAAVVNSFAGWAFAQSEFYIVQDTSTKRCTIVDKKPTVTTQTVVAPSGTVYTTRAEAEAGMKTVKVCTTGIEPLSPWDCGKPGKPPCTER